MTNNSESKLPLAMVPSLPARSFAELEALAQALDGVAPGFQIDVVDGKFVPPKAWPFTELSPEKEWEKIKILPGSYIYELDAMVQNPEQYFAIWADLPLSRLIIHIGSTEKYGECIRFAHEHNFQIGFALTAEVPVSFLEPYLAKIDFVQLMGIAKVGQQGQSFDERILEHAKTLRDRHSKLSIAIDGAVNAETIPRLLEAGVNHFAPGSAISQAPDPVMAYKQLHGLLRW